MQQQQQQQHELADTQTQVLFQPKHPCSVRVHKPSSFIRRGKNWTTRRSSGNASVASCEASTVSSHSISSLVRFNSSPKKSIQQSKHGLDSTDKDGATARASSPRRTQRNLFMLVGGSRHSAGDTCSDTSGSPKSIRSVKTTINEADNVSTTTSVNDTNDLEIKLQIINESSDDKDSQVAITGNDPTSSSADLTCAAAILTDLQSTLDSITRTSQDCVECMDLPSNPQNISNSVDLLYLNSSPGPCDVDSVLEDEMEELECRLLSRKQFLVPHQNLPQHEQTSHEVVSVSANCEPRSSLSKVKLVRNGTDSSMMSKASIRSAFSAVTCPVDVDSVNEIYGSEMDDMMSTSRPENDESISSIQLESLASSGPVDVDDFINAHDDDDDENFPGGEFFILDEVEISRGLAGYEIGFEPEMIWCWELSQLPPIYERDGEEDCDGGGKSRRKKKNRHRRHHSNAESSYSRFSF